MPLLQVSAFVHALPSSQVVPVSGFAAEHNPVAGTQAPGLMQAAAEHVLRFPPTQMPP